jgi:very-short-patch-repair endonuclease
MKLHDPYYGFACVLGQTPGVPSFVREHKFHLTRKWRLDFAWPEQKLALEIEGITFAGGRHQRIGGFRRDCEKYNALTLAGWSLLRVTPGDVRSGRAIRLVMEWFAAQRN